MRFLSNSNLNSLQWSPDGKFLIFETGQRTETPQLVRVDLVPKQPKFPEDKFDDLFKPEPAGARPGAAADGAPEGAAAAARGRAEAAGESGIRFRPHSRAACRVLNTAGLTINNPVISPDGKYLLYSGTAGGADQSLSLSAGRPEAARTRRRGGGGGGRGGGGGPARQLTNTPGMRTHAQFSRRFARRLLPGRRQAFGHRRGQQAEPAP